MSDPTTRPTPEEQEDRRAKDRDYHRRVRAENPERERQHRIAWDAKHRDAYREKRRTSDRERYRRLHTRGDADE